MKTTKRQTKFSLSRSGEISEIAAQLLRYLEPAVSAQYERAGAAEFAPVTRGGSDAGLEPIREGSRHSTAPGPFQMPEANAAAVRTMAAEGMSEALGQLLLQPLRPLRTAPGAALPKETAQQLGDFPFAADTAEGTPAEIPSLLPRPAAPDQQTMDDISEFFRRDSRRYDRVFSGGNGA